jgi:hypothetical protein
MGMINLMPPGLYEAVITGVDENTANPELTEGGYLFSLEARTLDDIRALGANSPEDDQRFAAAARVSEVNETLYETYAQPIVRAMTTEASAEALRWAHPNRLRFAAFSDANPMMRPIAEIAQSVRENRRPVSADNPLLAMERAYSSWMESSLEAWGHARDSMTEMIFVNTYGRPLLQAMTGLRRAHGGQNVEKDLLRETHEAKMREALEARFETGEPVEGVVRALIYVQRGERSVDERVFAKLKILRAAEDETARLPVSELKRIFSEQALLLRLDEERAVEAIPALLTKNPDQRRVWLEALRSVVETQGPLSDESVCRLARIEALFAQPPKEAVHD